MEDMEVTAAEVMRDTVDMATRRLPRKIPFAGWVLSPARATPIYTRVAKFASVPGIAWTNLTKNRSATFRREEETNEARCLTRIGWSCNQFVSGNYFCPVCRL